MTTSQCRDEPLPTICQDAAQPPYGCEPGDERCIYGNGLYTAPGDPCAVTDTLDTRCTGTEAHEAVFWKELGPWFCLRWGNGFSDATGNADAFYCRTMAGEHTFRYVLPGPQLNLYVEPCAPIPFCAPEDPYQGTYWLTRYFVFNGGWNEGVGWRMHCNQWDEDDLQAPRLIVLELDRDTFTGAHVHFVEGSAAPDCFAPFQDVFCFSADCSAWPEWACIGASAPDRAEALDSIEVIPNVFVAQDQAAYPFGNPYQNVLTNAAWEMVNRIVDRLDDAHALRPKYDRSAVSTWECTELFDENNLTLQELELEPYPAVRGRGPSEEFPNGLYGEYADQPIPITCRALVTGAELPAALTLERLRTVMHLHVEERGGSSGGFRVFADLYFWLRLRVRLLPAAYEVGWPFQLIGRPEGTDDPYDLTVEDPDNPGGAHPFEILTPVGPQGERIWTEKSWRGLNTHPAFSRGSLRWNDVGGSNQSCCGCLRAIDQTEILAEINDCSELQWDGSRILKPQRYGGFVGLSVDFAGVVGGCT